jgi:hypothetical protein
LTTIVVPAGAGDDNEHRREQEFEPQRASDTVTLMASQLNTTCGNNTFEMFGFDDFLSCFRRGSCCSGALRRLLERRRVLGCADRAGPGYRQGCIRADGLWSQHEAVVGAFGCWQAFQA